MSWFISFSPTKIKVLTVYTVHPSVIFHFPAGHSRLVELVRRELDNDLEAMEEAH